MYSLFMAKIKVSSPVQDTRKDQESLDQAAQADACVREFVKDWKKREKVWADLLASSSKNSRPGIVCFDS